MHIRIVTFGLTVPADAYAAHCVEIAAQFTEWPGLVAKWWLQDTASGTFGGVYLFSSEADADRSRETVLFLRMLADPALTDVTVREYDVLDAPTAITAPAMQPAGTLPNRR
jgi:hypothetical protein